MDLESYLKKKPKYVMVKDTKQLVKVVGLWKSQEGIVVKAGDGQGWTGYLDKEGTVTQTHGNGESVQECWFYFFREIELCKPNIRPKPE